MPKGHRKRNNLKSSTFKVILLLLQFSLIRIGQIPFLLLVKIPLIFFKFLYYSRLPSFDLPSYTFKAPKLPTIGKHRRGRPRNKWFLPYYLNKFSLHFKKRVSRKSKISLVAGVVLLILYFYTSFIFTTAYQLPSPKRLISSEKALTTEFFDRNGKLLYRMYEGRNRTLIPLSELPLYLVQATIAAEDKNFYNHFGVDPVAIVRAIKSNLSKDLLQDGSNLEGGSTLTQQLIKNSLLTPEKTYIRKVKEIILSLWAERIYSKDEILSMYLNDSPYGGPTWGVEAASQTYFGKSARDLNLSQAAFLAGLPASPTQFSPYGSNPELGKMRQKEVLRRMVEDGFITQYKADETYKEDLNLKPPTNNILAPHFVMFVKDYLSAKYSQRAVSQGGLKIITTLDLRVQQEVENTVASEVEKLSNLNVKNGAAMVTDAKSGQILAMIGSKDYYDPNFGAFNVTTALRQPGSSIKVVTYAEAFKQGFSPGNTVLDVPVTFRDEWGNAYSPVNYDGKYRGAVSIRQALGSSYNTTAVKLLANLGLDEVIGTAKDLGITTFSDPKRYGLSLTLGGAEVKMVDMMTVYGALSQMGSKNTTTPILKVTDSNGIVLEEYENKPSQVLAPEVAYLITDILADNNARKSAFGENSLLKIEGKTVSVKTGTSDNKRDNWTFGYTPEYVVGAWVGNPDNSPMHPALTSGVTGAAPIWHKIMANLLKEKPDIKFERPKGIIEGRVDGRRDLTIAQALPKSLVRTAQKDNQTLFSDSYSTYASSSAQAKLP